MKLADVIRAPKTDVSAGAWKRGHIKREMFPLSYARAKNYKFGQDYQWRVVRFHCLEQKFRVLILLNEGKQIFRATLGFENAQDICVLCHHEFHGSEPGWHCHLTNKEHHAVPAGISRSHMRRWPQAKAPHSRLEFKVDLANALSVAAERFGFSVQGSLL